MVLTPRQELEFRRWMVKSLGGSVLALGILVSGWFIGELTSHMYLMALGGVMFGGFPLWNLIWESKKINLAVYYSLQITAVFSHQIAAMVFPDSIEPLFPPFDILYCTAIWLMSEYPMSLLMPQTFARIDGYRTWRDRTMQGILKAHY